MIAFRKLCGLLLAGAAGATLYAGVAVAQEKEAAASALGGALGVAQATQSTTLVKGGGFSFGFLPASEFGQTAGGSVGTGAGGGFLAWSGGAYRFDAMVRPFSLGGLAADVGASAGVEPGELGTSYGLHLGTAWLGDRFTINPVSRFGLAQLQDQANDVNVTFTVNHALTPSLSIVGAAEARRNLGGSSVIDPTISQSELVIGAGLGLRF